MPELVDKACPVQPGIVPVPIVPVSLDHGCAQIPVGLAVDLSNGDAFWMVDDCGRRSATFPGRFPLTARHGVKTAALAQEQIDELHCLRNRRHRGDLSSTTLKQFNFD
jgi:hypothetical protein